LASTPEAPACGLLDAEVSRGSVGLNRPAFVRLRDGDLPALLHDASVVVGTLLLDLPAGIRTITLQCRREGL